MISNILQESDFEFVRNLVRDKSAIVIEENKAYLVEARLSSLLKKSNVETLSQLIGMVRLSPNGTLAQSVVDAMTTNETSFFRDHHPFEALRKEIIPTLIRKREKEKTLHIWCAAASTGQEPYTIAMLIKEYFPELNGWNIKILATDIVEDVLDRARAGCYSQLEVNRGLPASMLVKCFHQSGNSWVLNDDIRKMVEFRKLNLIDRWPVMPKMDLVFLRNVLIYFDPQIKTKILEKMHMVLQPDGYLFLGATEMASAINVPTPIFEHVQIAGSFCFSPVQNKGV